MKSMSAKKKAYVVGFLILACILLWAFLSAGFMTNGFSRSQIKKGDERQEVDVESMILTETKNDTKYWEIYGETGTLSHRCHRRMDLSRSHLLHADGSFKEHKMMRHGRYRKEIILIHQT